MQKPAGSSLFNTGPRYFAGRAVRGRNRKNVKATMRFIRAFCVRDIIDQPCVLLYLTSGFDHVRRPRERCDPI